MKGFPQIIATKEDFENLLGEEKFKEQALMELQNLQDRDDRTATKMEKTLPEGSEFLIQNMIESPEISLDNLNILEITSEEIQSKLGKTFEELQTGWAENDEYERQSLLNTLLVEEIENSLPIHRQKGFERWLDVVKLNAEVQGTKVSELCEGYSATEIEAAVVELT